MTVRSLVKTASALLLISAWLILVHLPASTTTATDVGDVNSDGRITSVDAALILQFTAGLIPSVMAGDVNEDGQANSVDAALILQLNAGLIDRLPGKPLPPAGTVLYEADWSTGAAAWPQTFGWSWFDGEFVNDGTNAEEANWVAAPYRPGDKGIVNYTVEAVIHVVSFTPQSCPSFGIIGRALDSDRAYLSGVNQRCSEGVFIDTFESPDIATAGFQPLADTTYTFRVEHEANTIRLFIDDAQLLEVDDNRYLQGGSVGLWSDQVQISVVSFRVVAL